MTSRGLDAWKHSRTAAGRNKLFNRACIGNMSGDFARMCACACDGKKLTCSTGTINGF